MEPRSRVRRSRRAAPIIAIVAPAVAVAGCAAGLLEAVEAETDPDRAAAAYPDINPYVVENAWFAPLFSISTN